MLAPFNNRFSALPVSEDLCDREEYARSHPVECSMLKLKGAGRGARGSTAERSSSSKTRSYERKLMRTDEYEREMFSEKAKPEQSGKSVGNKYQEPVNPDLCVDEKYYAMHPGECSLVTLKEDARIKSLRRLEASIRLPEPSELKLQVPESVLSQVEGWRASSLDDLAKKYRELLASIAETKLEQLKRIERWYEEEKRKEEKAYEEAKEKLASELKEKEESVEKLYRKWKEEGKTVVKVDLDDDGEYEKTMSLDEWRQWVKSYLEQQYREKLEKLDSSHRERLEKLLSMYREKKSLVENWYDQEKARIEAWYERAKARLEQISRFMVELNGLMAVARREGWDPRRFEVAAKKLASRMGLDPEKDEAAKDLIKRSVETYSNYYYNVIVPKKTASKIKELEKYAESLMSKYVKEFEAGKYYSEEYVEEIVRRYKDELMMKARQLLIGDYTAKPVIDSYAARLERKLREMLGLKLREIDERVDLEIQVVDNMLASLSPNVIYDPSWADRAIESLRRELDSFKYWLLSKCPTCMDKYEKVERKIRDVEEKLRKLAEFSRGIRKLIDRIVSKYSTAYVMREALGAPRVGIEIPESVAQHTPGVVTKLVEVNPETATAIEKALRAMILNRGENIEKLIDDPAVKEILKPVEDYVKRNRVPVPLDWDKVTRYFEILALKKLVSEIQEKAKMFYRRRDAVCYPKDGKTYCDVYDDYTGRYIVTYVYPGGVDPGRALADLAARALLRGEYIANGYTAKNQEEAGYIVAGLLKRKGLEKEANEALCRYASNVKSLEFWETGVPACSLSLAQGMHDKRLRAVREALESKSLMEGLKKGLEAALYGLAAAGLGVAAGVAAGAVGTAEMLVNPVKAFKETKKLLENAGAIAEEYKKSLTGRYGPVEAAFLAGMLGAGLLTGAGAEGAAASLAASSVRAARAVGKAGQALLKASAAGAGAGAVAAAYESGGLPAAVGLGSLLAGAATLRPERISSIETSGYKGYRLKFRNPLTGEERTLSYVIRGSGEGKTRLKVGLGSPGKTEEFLSMKFSGPEENVAGLYSSSADVRDVAEALRRRGYTREAELVEKTYKAAKRAYKVFKIKPFKNLDIRFSVDEGDVIGQAVKEFLQTHSDSVEALYGSMIYKSHLGEWWREVHDIDVMLKTSNPEEAKALAKQLAEYINRKVGRDVAFAEDTTVYVRTPKGKEKIVDIHYYGEVLPKELPVWGAKEGVMMGVSPDIRKVEGLGAYGAEHGALAKGESSIIPRRGNVEEAIRIYEKYVKEGLLNKEYLDYLKKLSTEMGSEEILYTGPAPWRQKDVADFLYLLYKAAVEERDPELMKLASELERMFKEKGLIPKNFSLKNYKPSEISENVLRFFNMIKKNRNLSLAGIRAIANNISMRVSGRPYAYSTASTSASSVASLSLSLPSFSAGYAGLSSSLSSASGTSESSTTQVSTKSLSSSTAESRGSTSTAQSSSLSYPTSTSVTSTSLETTSTSLSLPSTSFKSYSYSIKTPSTSSTSLKSNESESSESSESESSEDSSKSESSSTSQGSQSTGSAGSLRGSRRVFSAPVSPFPSTGYYGGIGLGRGRRVGEVLILL